MHKTIIHLKNLIEVAESHADFEIARTAVRDSDIPRIIKVDFFRQLSDKQSRQAFIEECFHAREALFSS